MRRPHHLPWLAASAAAACFALAGCEVRQQPDGNDQATSNGILPAPPLPIAEPPLDRASLLEAVAEAASAAALGRDDGELQRRLDGDRFEVRIRFGCAADAEGAPRDAPYAARFDAEARTLRLRAAPDLTLDAPAVAELAGEGVEAVEGFWLRRPWLLASGCPALPQPQPQPPADPPQDAPANAADAAAPAAPAPAPHIGIAQFFTETDSRTRRRNQRAYEATKVLAAGEQPSQQGYDLVLSGRLRRLAGSKVIACRVAAADAPPQCVVSAEFDRVRIERPDSRAILAEWRS